MRARTFFSPYLFLLFILVILALLEWMNIASPSQTNPLQHQPGQLPFSPQGVPVESTGWVIGVPDTAVDRQARLFPRDFLLAGQTYLPLTTYPIHLLLSGHG